MRGYYQKRYYVADDNKKSNIKDSSDIANQTLYFIGVLEEEEAKQFVKLYLKALHNKGVNIEDKKVYQCIAEVDPRFSRE